MAGILGDRPDGSGYRIDVVRGVTFTDYEYALDGGKSASVRVEQGVITAPDIPPEIGADEARSWAALLLEAADELERQHGK